MGDSRQQSDRLAAHLAEVELALHALRSRRDREQFETAALREVARASRRLRIALRVNAMLPTEANANWLVGSIDQLDRSLARLEAIEDSTAEADTGELATTP